MRKIMIASHGYMAEGMLSAAEMIMGPCDNIQAYGLADHKSPAAIMELIEAQLRQDSESEYIIFCDIRGGSVHNQLLQLYRYPNVYLVGGVTLSMLLECQMNCEDMTTDELMIQIVRSAKESMVYISRAQIAEELKKKPEEGSLW